MGFVRRWAATATAVALTLPMLVLGSAQASAASCLSGTRTSFHTVGSPFTGGTTLTWSVSSECTSLTLTLNGQAVARTGAKTVHPTATTKYVLVARAGTTTVTLGSRIAIAGKIMGYTSEVYGTWLEQEGVGAGTTQARSVSGRMLAALSNQARTRFVGKVLEVHIIPTGVPLTSLRPFTDLDTTGGVVDRDWATVRGMGGLVIEGTNRIAVAVGAEELGDPNGDPEYGPGYTMAHELAHTIMDHMAPTTLEASVADALADRGPAADYLGLDSYTKSNADEYWAENSAAMFGYEYGAQFDDEYNERWLVEHDPRMQKIVAGVFSGR